MIKYSLSAIISFFLILISVFIVHAAVTLLYFLAVPGDGEVTLIWETATELDTAGFFINRSDQEDGTYQRINSPIKPAQGDSVSGEEYEYIDEDVENGTEYWYMLETIDFDQSSEFFDPVSAIPGSSVTPSPTGSQTASPTLTITPPSSRGTPEASTPTTPVRATATYTSAAPYPGPAATTEAAVHQATDPAERESSGDATATLLPFPTITIIFPTAIVEVQPGTLPSTTNIEPTDEVSGIPEMIRFWPVGLIVLVWVFLAIWYFVFHRTLN